MGIPQVACVVISDTLGDPAGEWDDDAMARISGRCGRYFNGSFAGIRLPYPPADPLGYGGWAAGMLVLNQLQSLWEGALPSERGPGVILVNMAPRAGEINHAENGTRWVSFEYGASSPNGIVGATTYSPQVLAVLRHFGVTDQIRIYGREQIAAALGWRHRLTPRMIYDRAEGQFGSLDAQPEIAHEILSGQELPGGDAKLAQLDLPELPLLVWKVDPQFGNCVLTVLPEEIGFEAGKFLQVNGRRVVCRRQLREVRIGEVALTEGSSGLGPNRLVELVIGQARADEFFGVVPDSQLKIAAI
jgi:hypothetical protein